MPFHVPLPHSRAGLIRRIRSRGVNGESSAPVAVVLVCAAAAVLTSRAAQLAHLRHAAAAADLPPGGVPSVRVPTMEWTDAGDGYQQATAEVPYDYDRPHSRSPDRAPFDLPPA
jgi:hypothetical protein